MTPHVFAGRFDPKFIGITIRARTASELESFRLQASSQRSSKDILEELGDDAVLSDLSRGSVVDHEIRHFHDSLLFPFGDRVIRSRIHAVHNGFVTAQKLKEFNGDANAIVVPLQQWLSLNDDERRAFLREVSRSTGKELRVPAMPTVGENDDLSDLPTGALEVDADDDAAVLLAGCRSALADYRTLERFWTSPHIPGDPIVLAAVDIWEVSGLVCQAAAIATSLSASLMQRFLNWVRASGPRSYRRGLDVIERCLQALGWHPVLRNILVLTTWAQMGEYQGEMTYSSPAYRLSALIRAADDGCRYSADSTFRDLVAAWDQLAGTDSFGAIAGTNERYAEFVAHVATGSLGFQFLSSGLFAGIDVARRQTLQAFLTDPDRYVDPELYLCGTDFPKPSIGVEYPTKSDLHTDWMDLTPNDWSPPIDFGQNLSLVAITELSDAVFLPGEKSLQPWAREKVRYLLDLEPIRLIR